MQAAYSFGAVGALLERFTVFYSRIPEEMEHFRFLFVGLDGDRHLAPWMWISAIAAILALVLLLVPRWRASEMLLAAAALLVFVSLWIEKGLGLIVGGFVPSPLGSVTRYSPTAPEWVIVLGVWAIGALLITVLYKITVSVREVR